jgi:3',5'-cyclic AMP phosphodiesterase CpdA
MRNRNILGRVALLVMLAGALSACRSPQIARKLVDVEHLPPTFTFVVIGDNRAGNPSTDAVYARLLPMVMDRKPDLLINVGDQIETPGKREHWSRFWELSRDVSVPYFLTVGNHDVHSTAPLSEMLYLEQVDLPGNELYYSFVAGDALFVVLDSYLADEEKRITGKQFAWLKGVFESSKQKYRFVFLHHPLYPEPGRGKHAGNSLDRYTEDRDRLHALFKKYVVTLVFAGHEHLYLRKTVDGIPYVITGGGGAPLYADDENGGFHHFVVMTVDGDTVRGEVVDVNGNVRDKF